MRPARPPQMTAVVTVLAHAGCFVPAAWCSVRAADRVFARVAEGGPHSGAPEANASTFLAEMRDAAFLLHNCSRRSLVCVDELGRATSTAEGFALAWAVCERLLAAGALALCATHMERLAQLAAVYPACRVTHFLADTSRARRPPHRCSRSCLLLLRILL